jgi:diacylglycerol kinase family enzyme
LVPKIIGGHHLGDKAVRRFSTDKFELSADLTWPVEADGEPIGNTPVSVTVEPGAIVLKI